MPNRLDRAGRWALASGAAAALIAGCAMPVAEKGADAAPPPVATTLEPRPPTEVRNNTGLPHVTLAGVDKYGEYTTLTLKASWAFDDTGQMRLLPAAQQESIIDMNTPTDHEFDCAAYGGAFNQRTTWFPDTGLFVAGGRLTALHGGAGQARVLLPLRADDHGAMAVLLEDGRELEYGYAPCVGAKRVHQGWRTNGYVAPGDWIELRAQGVRTRPLRLQVPGEPAPFVWLRFAGRPSQQALLPARIVLLTVDLAARRMVLQYQATVPMQPQVSRASLELTLSDERAAKDADLARRNAALKKYLVACTPPINPMDPCANPHGQLPAVLQ